MAQPGSRLLIGLRAHGEGYVEQPAVSGELRAGGYGRGCSREPNMPVKRAR
jgi:hypothetical protein